MKGRKSRLFTIMSSMREELDDAEAEISALVEHEPGAVDEDLEIMRDRLDALELRVVAIEGSGT